MTEPGLQAGAHHHRRRFVFALRFRQVDRITRTRVLRVATLMVSAVHALPAQAPADARFRITSSAILSLDRSPQPPLVDTVATSSLVTIALSDGADTIATMSVDSLTVTSTGMIRRAADAFSRGISVSALLNAGRPRVTGDSSSACTAERPLAGLLPELLPLLPAALGPDQQWSDTLTVTTCRAGLPVTTVTIATFRTLTGMDSTTLLLERRAVIRATGASTIRSQLVSLTGSGTSESLAVVSIAARRIQSWRGSQTLEFEITNGQQTRRLIQQLSDSAAPIP